MLIAHFSPQEAVGVVDSRAWPTLLDSDDLPKKKLTAIYKAPTPEMICYLDFSVSTTGMLAGVKVSKQISILFFIMSEVCGMSEASKRRKCPCGLVPAFQTSESRDLGFEP